MQNTYEYDLQLASYDAILKCKKSEKLAFWTMSKHFSQVSK